MTYLYLIFFILGTIIGSFLNVLVLRYNTGLSVTFGRSKCFSCGKELQWYELVPVLSYIILRGKCSNCASKISIQYPAVELITGLLFVLVFYKYTFNYELLVLGLINISLLIAISIYDIKHKIIPDLWVFLFAFFSLISIFFTYGFNFSSPVIYSLLAGPILFSFFFLLWFVSKGKWMGFGDAKLSLGVGFALGLGMGVSAIVFSFWIGAIISLMLIGLQKLNLFKGHLSIKSEVPFAPFIIVSFLIHYFLNFDIIYLINLI